MAQPYQKRNRRKAVGHKAVAIRVPVRLVVQCDVVRRDRGAVARSIEVQNANLCRLFDHVCPL